MDDAQLFLFVPIPAKAKKLGLLSIYKFSLQLRFFLSGIRPLSKPSFSAPSSSYVHMADVLSISDRYLLSSAYELLEF